MARGARSVAYLFLAVIVAFMLLSFAYLKLNDFAKETLDVIFPAIGAIGLSLYLGVKVIWIDAPKPERARVPIAVLHDRATGAIHSMAVFMPKEPMDQFSEFRGVRELDTLPSYVALADLRLRDRLRVAKDGDTTSANSILTDLVEYSILAWLATPAMNVGWDDLGTIYLVQGAIGGGGWPITYAPVPVVQAPKGANVLLERLPISVSLPPGSSVFRDGAQGRRIEIRTKHSYLRINLSARGGSAFDGATDPVGTRLQDALKASA